ncbi:MAG: MlaD family protein [Bacteriovoracaceae bacterium]
MRYKFNPFERMVGLFLTSTVAGSVIFGVGVAVKKHWFEEKNYYTAYSKSADGIRDGAAVQISGLKIGKIEEVDLEQDGRIKIKFSVLKKYEKSIPQDSGVIFNRPYILGEKIININQGKSLYTLKNGSHLPTIESFDVIDLVAGDKMKDIIAKTQGILEHMEDIMVLGKDIAHQVGNKKQLQKTMANVAFASDSLKKLLPHVMDKTPQMADNMAIIVSNLTSLTTNLRELQPIVTEVAKTLPDGSKKAVEALHESVIILRAMQNSFLLRGSIAEIKKEEALRKPAGTPNEVNDEKDLHRP